MHVTYLDYADMPVVARDLAGRMGVESRVFFKPENILDADFGEDQFGAALLGRITHYLTEAQNASIFQRIYTGLSAKGLLLIDCPMPTDESDETISLLRLV